MKAVQLLTILCFIFLGSQAQANSILHRHRVLQGEHLKGKNKIPLRQHLKQMGVDIYKKELRAVVLHAKSRRGGGQATLIVGQDQESQNIPKARGLRPRKAWKSSLFKSYNKIRWDLTDTGKANERWQIRLQGNIKIHSLDLVLRDEIVRVVVDLNDEIYGGGHQAVDSLVRLKKLMRQKGYQPRNYELIHVALWAKSRKGHGRAKLMIGGQKVEVQQVPTAVSGYGFKSPVGKSYNRLGFNQLFVPGPGSGRWQIQLKGKNRLNSVVLFLRELD